MVVVVWVLFGFLRAFSVLLHMSMVLTNCCVALPYLINLSSNLLFFFFLFMLPNKETNSSEESECDDLDPNTSMEVETIILVVSHPTPLPCLEMPLLKRELGCLYCSWTYVPITCESHKR